MYLQGRGHPAALGSLWGDSRQRAEAACAPQRSPGEPGYPAFGYPGCSLLPPACRMDGLSATSLHETRGLGILPWSWGQVTLTTFVCTAPYKALGLLRLPGGACYPKP